MANAKRRVAPGKKDDDRTYEIELVTGVEGPALYLKLAGADYAYRFAGPKPWGGGMLTTVWRNVRLGAIRDAMRGARKDTAV